jgi:Fic family protein
MEKSDNKIVEIRPSGEPHLRFVPVSAKKSPAAMATFVLDFLCVHPFRDGNGRVSRLSTSLLLQSHCFQVARYISRRD